MIHVLNTRPRPLRAFTLAEMLVAMMIVALLMAGIGSAVLISSQALPSNSESQTIRADAAALLDQIESELTFAVAVPEQSATSIAFAVPDRNGDGNAERIRYSFDGGTRTITREYGGSDTQTVLSGVVSMKFDYTYETVHESYDGLPVEDAVETLLSSNSSSSAQQDFALANTSWIGQLIVPVLPGDAVSWRITRMQVLGERKRSTAANIRARVYAATDAAVPDSVYLEDQTLSGSLLSILGILPILSTYTTYEVAFSAAHQFQVQDKACVVVGQLSGSDGTLNLSFASGTGVLTGVPSTWTWSLAATSGMNHSCYGKITRRGAQTGFDRDYLTRVHAAIQTSAESAARAADVGLLNRPEVLSRRLHLDFSKNPLEVDEDGDGQADWSLYKGDEGDIVNGGLLSANLVYGATPDTAIEAKSVIKLKFRSTQVEGESDALRIVTEPVDDQGAAFVVSATLHANSTQTLRILDEKRNVLYQVEDLPDGLIDVRLIFDPSIDALSVSVGGSRTDTFALKRTALTFGGPAIQVGRLLDAVEIDDVRICIQ